MGGFYKEIEIIIFPPLRGGNQKEGENADYAPLILFPRHSPGFPARGEETIL
jgi:hypothetical protein